MDSPIAVIVQKYYPDWEPPPDRYEWNPCLCPAHDEDRPSCDVNYAVGAIKCKACGFKGNVVSIVQRKEGVPYAEAVRRTEAILGAGGVELPPELARKPGRRAFGSSGSERRDRGVPTRVRRGPAPWS